MPACVRNTNVCLEKWPSSTDLRTCMVFCTAPLMKDTQSTNAESRTLSLVAYNAILMRIERNKIRRKVLHW